MKAIARPTTLKQQALDQLRDSIMLGKLKPGSRLVERVLGEQLQVSRTVIRECIRHLESERLVTIVPNSGPIVTELNQDEIAEIYQLRALLECEGVKRCAAKIEHGDAQNLLALVDQIEQSLAKAQVIQALRKTTQLYAKIFEIGDLTVSWDLIAQLNSRINQLRIRSLSSQDRIKAGPKSLRAMVEAIARNDSALAAKACKKHVMAAMQAGLKETAILQQSENE